MDFTSVAFAIVTLVVGLFVGYLVRKATHEKELAGARNTATGILEEAKRE
ncbi:MAG: Rnase Y domain-containing protein, partial [Carnobacterium inhibens]